MSRTFPHRHLLGIEGMGRDDIVQVLDAAEAFFAISRRPVRKVPTLKGKTIINLFYEPSTRTRTSFELAGKRLSADVVNISAAASSVKKGETLRDTAQTLKAMQPDVIVMRHSAAGAPHYVAKHVDCSIVNAGDGAHEHPTQALLDAFTIRRAHGSLDGLTVTICGDIAHSRVARSNAHLLRLFGCNVRVVGPRTLMPADVSALGVVPYDRLEPALEGADVVMMLRIQHERMGGAYLPSLREYSRTFGLGPQHLRSLGESVIVMHPGPMNRGVEIHPAVADGPRSAVLDQVEAGVAIRMTLLYFLAGDTRAGAAKASANSGTVS